jgi:hypothetical protein
VPKQHNEDRETHYEGEYVGDYETELGHGMNPRHISQAERVNGVGVSEEGEEKPSNDEICHEKNEMPFIVQAHTLVHP